MCRYCASDVISNDHYLGHFLLQLFHLMVNSHLCNFYSPFFSHLLSTLFPSLLASPLALSLRFFSLLIIVANGTDYCDITGETDWVREMIDKYDSTAKKTGARIVHFCGHDCVPWDLAGEKMNYTKMKYGIN